MMLGLSGSLPFDVLKDIDTHLAETMGATARSGLQGAHITKQDLKSELHVAEGAAVVTTLATFALLIGGAIVWSKVR